MQLTLTTLRRNCPFFVRTNYKEGFRYGQDDWDLILLFENPFWVGIFERIDGGKLSVAKVTFGAKSQQALQLQREENKLERKLISHEIKEAEKQRQFELKQKKRKEKHRGR